MRAPLWLPLCLFCFAAAGVGCLRHHSAAGESSPAGSYDRAIERAPEFAFGGIGYGGNLSPGERGFFEVFDRPGAAENFRQIYRRGNAQAKMYALCGLHELDPSAFEQLVAAAGSLPGEVRVMSGCIAYRRSGSEIAGMISDGHYSDYVTSGGRR